MTTTTHEVSTTRSIKQSLSSHFNHEFSVRQGKGSSRYIYIKWEDGPSWDQVHEFCRKYNDDGKDDLIGCWNGVPGIWVRYFNGVWEKINDTEAISFTAGKIR